MHRLGPVDPGRPAAATLVALLSLVALPGCLAAQDSGGFLFGRPGLSLGLYGGYAVPSADGEIFDFTRERLTVDENDFRSFAFGGRLDVRLTERFDLGVDVGRAVGGTASEFRDLVDQDDRPIEQTTSFSRTSATLNLKAYLWERGRSIGRYVWIPRTFSPYLGVGGGVMWYGFEQEGDFVDSQTLDIFSDEFTSNGSTATWHFLGGVDVSLTPRFFLTGQLGYAWGDAEMGDDFVGFDGIDLSGFQTTAGVAVRL